MKSNIFDINNVELEVGQTVKFWQHKNLSKETSFFGTIYKDSMVLVEGEIIFEYGSYCIRTEMGIICIRDYFINSSNEIIKLYKGINSRSNLLEFLTLGEFFNESLSNHCSTLYEKYRGVYTMLQVMRGSLCKEDSVRLQEANENWNLFWDELKKYIDTKIKQIEVI